MGGLSDLVLIEQHDRGVLVLANGKGILRLRELQYRLGMDEPSINYSAGFLPAFALRLERLGIECMGETANAPKRKGYACAGYVFGNMVEPILFVSRPRSDEKNIHNCGILMYLDADHPIYRPALATIKAFMDSSFQKMH